MSASNGSFSGGNHNTIPNRQVAPSSSSSTNPYLNRPSTNPILNNQPQKPTNPQHLQKNPNYSLNPNHYVFCSGHELNSF